MEGFLGTDDMLPIVALPNGFSKSFADCGLEGAYHRGDGSGMPDPYIIQNPDAVEVVRHDHEGIKRHLREMLRNLVPAGGDHFGNSTEHWSSIASTDRDEVCARS
jgi:hypothetical protein